MGVLINLDYSKINGRTKPHNNLEKFTSSIDQLDIYPDRIICLTEETTETLYLLGEDSRIVGVSGYTVRPKEARLKPRVSGFTHANLEKIERLNPDIVLAFSDLQADITRDLIKRGLTLLTFNQRSINGIFEMIQTLGNLVGNKKKARKLVNQILVGLAHIQASAHSFPRRPRVFFEEWANPLISGIQWVEELVELAGGVPIFPELRQKHLGKDRIVDPKKVICRDPEVIIASWCGVKVNKSKIKGRPGWSKLSAIKRGHIYEIKSAFILQPGPAALIEGVRQIHAILAKVVGIKVSTKLKSEELVDPLIRQTN
jgi:iron complex transport system substrate-binding protein